MTTLKDILQDADPLRHERDRLDGQRDQLHHAVVAAASDVVAPSYRSLRRTPVALLATVALVLVGVVAVGSRMWSQGGATLQAAVRFEMRLAEDRQAAGLREARIPGSDRVIYLYQEAIVTNSDIARSSVVPGDGPSRFWVNVQFNDTGSQKMREATRDHLGRPVAILIDGEVVIAPTLKSPIGASAVISGDYTKAEAERIVNGIGLR